MYNEQRAKTALSSLTKLVPKYTPTLRDEVINNVDNSQLVIGDIIILQPGI